ncbi:MAG: sleB [Verrucomicrobiaceae bacterium]|nr:sleB [Verrucomicrobiaceae bacterium]
MAEKLENLKSISSIVSAVVIPVVVLIVGNNYSTATKERELQGKFVELAVAILREPPEKQAHNLRDWATQVITNYSGVPLSVEAKKDLIENIQLPGSTISLRDAQTMLSAIGYYSGPIDGQYGAQLRQAIAKFQQDNGVAADGILGPRTFALIKDKYDGVKSGAGDQVK